MTMLGEVLRLTATTPNTNTKTGTYSQALPVGTVVVVALNAPVSGTWSTPALTDAAGNTYTVRLEQHAAAAANYQLAVFTSVLTHAVTTSTTWTATVTGANPAKWMLLGVAFDEATGFDVGASAVGSSGTASSGDTAAASQAKQYVVGAFAFTDASLATVFDVPGATVLAKASATDRSLGVAYQQVDVAGVRSMTGTLSPSQGWAAAVAALNGAAPPPPVVQVIRVWDGSTLRPAKVEAWT